MKITEDTLTIAVDLQGGMCDRIMRGEQGIINNAKVSLDCWKFLAPDDEDIQNMSEPATLEDALAILFTDNFHIEEVKDLAQVRKLCEDESINIDLNNIEFTDNLYAIY